jgi:signal transduction histidine kinase
MSIRVRLVLSYIAMLIVPIVLSVLTVVLIAVAFLGDLRSLYQVAGQNGNPIQNIIEQEAALYADIQSMSAREPESLLLKTVDEELDNRLNKINMGLIVRKNNTILYVSPHLQNTRELNNLPAYGTTTARGLANKHGFGVDGRDMEFNHNLWITRQDDFLLPDQSKISVFVATDPTGVQGYVRHYAFALVISLVVILVLTNGVLTYIVSRSIIRPLKALQRATEQIKKGNLDFEVKPQSRDEIGELSAAFEEMRKQLKHSIEVQLQVDENRKELMSNISHDLKTPVTAIKGYVEGIIDGVADSPDKLDRYVKTIYSKASDMDRMIDELFLFSKLDLGKLPFHFEEVELGHYLQDCAQELYFDVEKKDVKLELDVDTETPLYVKGDREKLKRVLLNIIENAVKYMDKAEGHIRLRMQTIDDKAVVSIEDNGQGIPEEALAHIFDRFYRADPSRNRATGGSGLGLAIAKQIVEEHGGLIWASSEVGQGTKVYLMLPIWKRGNDKNVENV